MIIALEKASSPTALLIGPLIDLLSGKDGYCHAELLFADGISATALPTEGVVVRRRKFSCGDWRFFAAGCHASEADVRKWCAAQCGKRYDWRGVLGFVLPWEKADPADYFCSELVVAALQTCGLFAGVDAWRTSPNRLLELCLATRAGPAD